jgi:hypothetical protein
MRSRSILHFLNIQGVPDSQNPFHILLIHQPKAYPSIRFPMSTSQKRHNTSRFAQTLALRCRDTSAPRAFDPLPERQYHNRIGRAVRLAIKSR